MVIQLKLSVAFQLQQLNEVLTLMLPVPPLDPNDRLGGEMEMVQLPAA